MTNRRRFIHQSIAVPAAGLAVLQACKAPAGTLQGGSVTKPVVLSTWDFGQKANARAWQILQNQGRALDAVEAGVMVIEADESNQTVGIGGLPDRDGLVTLDACIMDEYGNAGSVCFLQHIKHPVAVARRVMEKTPHVMLAGAGALKFALEQGFIKENLLTPTAKEAWENWLKTAQYKPIINIENHDTISMLALDESGKMAGACTTSGLAYKMHGRVGDSPIIGAGLFVDNEVGGAAATGLGEAVLKTLGSFLVVELMRQGRTPLEACTEAVTRIAKKQKNPRDMQIGYLAMNMAGDYAGYSLQKGFSYAVKTKSVDEVIAARYYLTS